MRKANDLRRWLTAYLPDLKKNPENLSIYIDAGRINARRSKTLSFSYSYALKVTIFDFAADPDTLMVPILAWIEKEQPQLLQRADSQPFGFEAQPLDTEKFDIEIAIDLTEPVLVIPRPDGSGYDVEHIPEPKFPDSFAGVHASFLQGFGNTELLVETEDPEAVLTPAVPPAV